MKGLSMEPYLRILHDAEHLMMWIITFGLATCVSIFMVTMWGLLAWNIGSHLIKCLLGGFGWEVVVRRRSVDA